MLALASANGRGGRPLRLHPVCSAATAEAMLCSKAHAKATTPVAAQCTRVRNSHRCRRGSSEWVPTARS
jgi:hypothetical protein